MKNGTNDYGISFPAEYGSYQDSDMQDAVIYARYSSHSQREVSIEQQVSDCEEYARRNNLRIVAVYADKHLTGTNDKRPQFQKMLKDAQHGKWLYVITWKVDRFARNRYDSATYKYRLKKYGVRVLYAKESIPDGPEGILLESVLEGSAEYYSANLSQNIRRGMRYNAMDCKVNGRIMPIGYQKGDDGRYAIKEDEAEIVREIFRRIADGEPIIGIANDLNSRGIRTKRGNLWNKCSFHSLLANEMYIGVYSYSDIRIEGGVPAIIDKALFEEVQRKLAAKKNAKGRHKENGEYMLTGKLFCGHCGASMVGCSGTSMNGEMYYYYACQKRRTEHGCNKKPVRRDWIERLVAKIALEYVLQPHVIEWMADTIMDFQEREAATAQLEALRSQLADNTKAIDNVMKAIEAGIITATTKKRLMELEAEASRLQRAIDDELKSTTKVERDFIIYWMEKFRRGDLESASFRRKVIDSFVNAVYLTDDHIRIAINCTGKQNTVDMAIVMDAESISEGLDCSYKLSVAPPKYIRNLTTSCGYFLSVIE